MINLITTSHARDLESCRLLCDSVDAHVSGFSRHYIVVAPEDLTLFSDLAGPRREIVDARDVVPLELVQLPLAWKGRRYFWAQGLGGPIYGWHLQQLRKIGMTLAQDAETVLHLDSDMCFVKPYDAGALAAGPLPLKCARAAIGAHLPQHVRWWINAHRVLGLGEASLPGDDFIGPMVAWDRRSVTEMVTRIGGNWAARIGRSRDFSEYLLYGLTVMSDDRLKARHRLVSSTPCKVYWSGPPLDRAGLAAFLSQMSPAQVSIVMQSFTETPPELVREVALAQGSAT